jgi:hypothetical protein
MVSHVRGRALMGALVAFLCVAGTASPASALPLSFEVPPGSRITNLAFESFDLPFNAYNGDDPESFNINVKLVHMELNGDPGTLFTDFPTDVVLNIQLTLQDDLGGTCGGVGTCTGTYAGYMTLWDTLGPDVDDVAILNGLLPDTDLTIVRTQFLFTFIDSITLAGDYDLLPPPDSDSVLYNALFDPAGDTQDGRLNLTITSTSGPLTFDADGKGLGSFDFGAAGAMNPDDPQPISPEPGTGLLLGGGLLALAASRRRRR